MEKICPDPGLCFAFKNFCGKFLPCEMWKRTKFSARFAHFEFFSENVSRKSPVAYLMQLFFFVRRRAAGVFGRMMPSANHLLTYEKEFAIDEDSFIPKPRFFGHDGSLLSGRTAQVAIADFFRSPFCGVASPRDAGDAVISGHLAVGEQFDTPLVEADTRPGAFSAGLFLVPAHQLQGRMDAT